MRRRMRVTYGGCGFNTSPMGRRVINQLRPKNVLLRLFDDKRYRKSRGVASYDTVITRRVTLTLMEGQRR